MNSVDQKLSALQTWWNEKQSIISLFFTTTQKQKHSPLYVKMGEIYWAKLGVNVGREIDKMRPVIIYQGNDGRLKRSDMVFVIPITSSVHKRIFSVVLDKEDTEDKNVFGSIILQQARHISKFRLGRKITMLKNKEVLYSIQKQLSKILYKNTPLDQKSRGTIHKEVNQSSLKKENS